MQSKYIIANWKQNPKTLVEAKKLLEITKDFNDEQGKKENKKYKLEIAHAVPSIFAGVLAAESKEIFVQDIFWAEDGAYTGKYGAAQAKSAGIYMSLVGHSETRESKQNKKGYTNEEIAQKLENLSKNKMWACLCVGEEVRNKNYKQALKMQITKSLEKTKAADLKNICLAYEPVWAIGSAAKRAATTAEIVESIDAIKDILKELYPSKDDKITKNTITLYGGSVDKDNILEILALPNVGGLLIGRASSDAKKWKGILDKVLKSK